MAPRHARRALRARRSSDNVGCHCNEQGRRRSSRELRQNGWEDAMKPAPFDYVAPTSLEEAVEVLAAANGEGKIMAGGQSLVPLLNFRVTRPSVVVDLRKIPGLSFIEDRGSTIAIGALTRHADVERSSIVAAKLPVMSVAMPHVAHLAIRNRGTIG